MIIEKEKLISQTSKLNWYMRMVRTTQFWLATTIYVVVLSVLVVWLHSLGVFYKWMVPALIVALGLAFLVSLTTLLRLSGSNNKRD